MVQGERPAGLTARKKTPDNTERFVRATELAASGRDAEAASLLRRILDSQPKHLAAAQALADIVAAGRAPGDADAARHTARRIEAEAAYNVGKTALDVGRYDIALRCYRKAVELDPEHDDAVWGLAQAYHADGKADEAIRWYRHYLARHPDEPETLHMIAALGGAPAPSRASDAYVREVFDNFADEFDKQLLEYLDYRAPKLLAEIFRDSAPVRATDLDILDAGCGTGLSGLEFHACARTLTGIDLSGEMLKRARERGIYDALEEAEIGAYLRAHPDAYDLIVAADVFCYLGDLGEVLAAAAGALRPGGRLVLSVEAGEGDGYALTPSGRYVHARAYLRAAAAAAGLREILGRSDRLRNEYGVPVAGYLAVFERRAS